MNKAGNKVAITVSRIDPNINFAERNYIFIKPQAALSAGSYTISIDAGLKSKNGTAAGSKQSVSFSVASSDVKVTSITVSGKDGAAAVVNGQTLQMQAAVLPSNASDPGVTWSVTSGTGGAAISSSGLLKGTKAGTVTVTAKANDGSGVSGSTVINVNIPEEPTAVEFNDISGCWAETGIEALAESGIIAGYPDGAFKPDNNITRAEFTVILVKAFNLQAEDGKLFADTAGHWAQDYIATAQVLGIANGYDDDYFGPDDLITREQMAVMLVKAAGLATQSSETTFSDNNQISAWAKSGVGTAAAHNLISGYPDNTFVPQGKATRAEAATVVFMALR